MTKLKITALTEGVSLNNIRYTGVEMRKTAHEINDVPLLKDHESKVDNIMGRTGMDGKYNEALKTIEVSGDVPEGIDPSFDKRLKAKMIRNVSIGAHVDQMVKEHKEDEVMEARGIHYDEVSFTPTPGVKGTSVMMAEPISDKEAAEIAESIIKESVMFEKNKAESKKGDIMEEKKEESKVEAKVEEKKTEEPKIDLVQEKLKALDAKEKEIDETMKNLSALTEQMKKAQPKSEMGSAAAKESIIKENGVVKKRLESGRTLVKEANGDFYLI
jgi:hypothetical protein